MCPSQDLPSAPRYVLRAAHSKAQSCNLFTRELSRSADTAHILYSLLRSLPSSNCLSPHAPPASTSPCLVNLKGAYLDLAELDRALLSSQLCGSMGDQPAADVAVRSQMQAPCCDGGHFMKGLCHQSGLCKDVLRELQDLRCHIHRKPNRPNAMTACTDHQASTSVRGHRRKAAPEGWP